MKKEEVERNLLINELEAEVNLLGES